MTQWIVLLGLLQEWLLVNPIQASSLRNKELLEGFQPFLVVTSSPNNFVTSVGLLHYWGFPWDSLIANEYFVKVTQEVLLFPQTVHFPHFMPVLDPPPLSLKWFWLDIVGVRRCVWLSIELRSGFPMHPCILWAPAVFVLSCESRDICEKPIKG